MVNENHLSCYNTCTLAHTAQHKTQSQHLHNAFVELNFQIDSAKLEW